MRSNTPSSSVHGSSSAPAISPAEQNTDASALHSPNTVANAASNTQPTLDQQDIGQGDLGQSDFQDGVAVVLTSAPPMSPSSLSSPQDGHDTPVDETQALKDRLARALSELDVARRQISANVAKERIMTEQIDEQARKIETLIQENESTRDQLRKSKSREEYNELVEAWEELFPVIFSLYREGSHEKKEKRKAKELNSRLRSELQQHQDQDYPVTVQIMSEKIDDLRKENAQLVDEKGDLAKTAAGIFLRLMKANIVILKYSLVYKDPLTKDDFLLWTEQMTSLMEDLNLILSYLDLDTKPRAFEGVPTATQMESLARQEMERVTKYREMTETQPWSDFKETLISSLHEELKTFNS